MRITKNKRWNVHFEKAGWQWMAPALVTAASLGAYWAVHRRLSAGPDAIRLLKEDHARVKRLFEAFEGAETAAAMKEIANQVVMELQIHSILEEDLFYPAVRRETKDDDLVDLAEAEHQEANGLIADLQQLEPEHPRYKTVFRELAKHVREHIAEEEQEIMPKVESSPADLQRLGQMLQQRQKELKRRMQLPAMLA